MKGKKYVAYVSSHTMNNKNGINIFDVDVEKGTFKHKSAISITNASYISCSHNEKYIYSITDMGVSSFKILPDGDLLPINTASINGMRGCYLSSDYEDKFLFVAGYHDGKITVLKLNDDGSIGDITEEIFVKGMGEVTDRSFVPHVSCVKMSRDNKYLFASDTGMDHVNVYELNHMLGKLKQVDTIRCNVEAGSRHLIFSKDNKYIYILQEIQNAIDVYTYTPNEKFPDFEKIQTEYTVKDYHKKRSLSSALKFSEDTNYIVSTSSGDNNVIVFKRDEESGMLTKVLDLPVSGSHPKDAALFPDNKHLVSLNHESNTMTFFRIDTEKGTLAMCAKEVKIEKPNCIIIHAIE